MAKNPLRITDTILRDAHQSQAATRMRLEEMLPVADKLDKIGAEKVKLILLEDCGLTEQQAAERLAKYGPNKLQEAEKPTLLQRFLTQLKDPMLLILLIGMLLSTRKRKKTRGEEHEKH